MITKRRIALGLLLLPLLLFIIINLLFPLPIEKLNRPGSTLVIDRNGEWLRGFTAPDDSWRIYEPSLEEISPKLQTAVLTYEDRWFYHHLGVNPISVVQAAIDNIKAGRVVRGGSTITMQIARMMEPKERTVRSKMIEMFRAVQLELKYSKSELLTIYFNMAPYGGNIVGSSAAAQIYFNKPQNRLSLGEAALLAAIPNSPSALRPDVYPQNARKARKKVLERLLRFKQIDEREYQEAVNEPIPTKRHPMPFNAPHLARLLKSKEAEAHPKRIHSTIDIKIQGLAERILQTALTPLQSQGISTGTVIVMETETREVLAMVGSYDFFDQTGEGQVNGTVAPRSPGSALKPFIYALALDKGLITPERLLHDVPVDYSGYHPSNYDGGYRGYVTARDALASSLNVPAVNLQMQLSSPNERGSNISGYSFLKQAGISTLPEPEEHYGLSLILGGCEVTLLELTTLYAGIANYGNFAPYRLVKPKTAPQSINGDPQRLLSKAACFILTEMLTEVRRPDLPACFESAVNLPKVAWKTGTSYGHRDAWSIGYTPKYTIGVWVGNFNGRGVASLVGSEVAAPILFALFNALGSDRWFAPPRDVDTRKVCALSGMPLSLQCPTSKVDFYIRSTSSNEQCSIHKLVTVDNGTETSLCSHCRVGRDYRKVVFAEWPAEISTWLNRNGFALPTIPPHNPDCTGVIAGQGPIIQSPSEGSEYYIREGIPLEHQKICLEASVSNRTKQVFWFLNGELISNDTPSEASVTTNGNTHGAICFWIPVVGKHILTCVDDEGRSTNRILIVKG